MTRKGWLAVLALAALVVGVAADQVVETGEPRVETFTLTTGDAITLTDSIPGWSGASSIIIRNTGVAQGTIYLRTAGSNNEHPIEGETNENWPLDFDFSEIEDDTAMPDTLAKSVSGTFTVTLFGA